MEIEMKEETGKAEGKEAYQGLMAVEYLLKVSWCILTGRAEVEAPVPDIAFWQYN